MKKILTKKRLTKKRLKELMRYEPDVGYFMWKVSYGNVKKYSHAGCLDKHGYVQIGVAGKVYRAHQLAFLYMEGYIPEEVDHINRVRDDNRFSNLRAANRRINTKNQPLRCNNKSGFNGVSYDKQHKTWHARINHNNKSIHLGRFKNINDAINARKKANKKYGYHKNHGENVINA